MRLTVVLFLAMIACGGADRAAPAPGSQSRLGRPGVDAPKANCTCRNLTVGGRYPQSNGHTAPPPREALSEVVSVDEARCIATTRLVVSQEQGEKPCDADIFVIPPANPAG